VSGVKLGCPLKYIAAKVVDVAVEGDGTDLKSFISERWNILDVWLQLKPEDGVAP